MSGFLCAMVGASFTVAAVAEVLRAKAGISANGNAQVSTAQSKFGGSSALFDGSGDFLTVSPTTGLADLMNGDFTIEFWMYSPETGIDGTYGDALIGIDGGGSGSNGWLIRTYGSKLQWVYDGQGGYDVATFNPSANTWHHIAFVRSGTTLKCYTDGTERTVTSYADRKSNSGSYNIRIGKVYTSLNDDYNGYLDEIRVSNTARYTTTFTPSTTAFVNDANTLFLMHANGTNASTFFEDDNGVRAPNGISANGNAQISTAQSQFGGSSIVFDGSGDYLIVPASSDFNFGTGNFTIEMWFRRISGGAIDLIIGNRDTGFVSGNIAFYTYSSSIEFDYRNALVSNNTLTTSISNNIWYHFAIVRNGTSLTLYKDGAVGQAKTIGSTETFGSSSFNLSIGCNTVGTFPLNGYIDELRISNTARYTTTFTAPTQPFVNDANTLLLIHADGTNASTVIRDDNGAIPVSVRTAKTLTAIGNAQIDTAQYKFGGSALLLDGTGDYVASPAGTQWNFGTGSFTIEFWIRFNVINTLYVPIALRSSGSMFNGEWWCEIEAASNKMYWGFKNQAGTEHYVAFPFGSTAFATGQWYHIALVNNAGTAQLYINGTTQGSTTAFSGSFGNSTTDLWLGAGVGGYSLNGWMDEVRISNTARYTAAFTPPAGPFTNDSQTLLLMHMEGADASTTFTDDTLYQRTQKGIVAIGNAQVDTAQSKFGGSSYLGDGSGDRLNVIGEVLQSQYTIEYWFRASSFSNGPTLVDLRSGGSANYSDYITSGGVFTVFINNGDRIQTGALSTNTWYHIAVVRDSSNDIKLYVNGTKTGNTYNFNGFGTGTNWYIGDNYVFASSFNGHIDEVRISNTARYTTTFTPSTTPFQNDANTVLLMHMDGTDGSTAFFDDNGIAPYTP